MLSRATYSSATAIVESAEVCDEMRRYSTFEERVYYFFTTFGADVIRNMETVLYIAVMSLLFCYQYQEVNDSNLFLVRTYISKR